MEQKHLVTRTVDQADRRVRFARITSDREDLLDTLVPVHNRNMQALLKELTAGEKQSLALCLRGYAEISEPGAHEPCVEMKTEDSYGR